MRACKGPCGRKLPLTAFDKSPRCADGRRPRCRKCCNYAGSTGPRVQIHDSPPKKFRRKLEGKRFLITSAQNATPIDGPFFDVLKVAAADMGAELVVIPLRYKNPTTRLEHRKQESDEWWDDAVAPFLFNGRKKLCPHLVLVGDVKVQPTAALPLSGFESLTGAESCIIGHPKMQFLTVPVPHTAYPKILTTTGSCTKRNYSDTRAGKVGEFHHFLGAIVVEVEGSKFHVRQVNADRATGEFIDLGKRYTAAGVEAAPPALALVMGDTHVRVTDPAVDRATFGAGGMVEVLNPDTLVFHDLIDGETTNPHDLGNPFIAEAKRQAGRQDVRAELSQVVEFVNERGAGRQVVIVDSNHHDFLARWVIKSDWKADLKNAAFYLETAQAMLASSRMGPGGAEYADPFPYWMARLGAAANVRCLGADESCQVGGIEVGMHGHAGPNGAKGSLRNLSRLGARVIIGHTHAPGIQEGGYQTGTSTPRRLAYMRGPGSHLNTHCVIYANGKRALLSVIDGRWKL